MVTGPLMDPSEHDRLAELGEGAGVTVRRVVPALRSHVALADCLVAMGGYNTTCDVLSFRLPTILVPRTGPSQEQRLRAARLAEWGVVSTVPAGERCAQELATAITASLAAPALPPCPVALDGLERAVDVFETALREVRAA
jgi:predicted glycosyltransferase